MSDPFPPVVLSFKALAHLGMVEWSEKNNAPLSGWMLALQAIQKVAEAEDQVATAVAVRDVIWSTP